MYRIFISILLIILLLAAPDETVFGQTEIYGKLLTAEGTTFPATVISIHMQNQTDIFAGYDDHSAKEDGSYRLTLREPGLYSITFRGVYHQTLIVPVLVANQPAIQMDVVLLPIYFNDGRYFANEEYLSWIRVVGDFNNYDFSTGVNFSLHDDGSISAYIPVVADTVRYQVHGLGYGRGGAAPLPLADEYNVLENRSFEAVVYTDLPQDSLEVRYTPHQTIPYKLYMPDDLESVPYIINGFIRLHQEQDTYWIQPLVVNQFFQRSFHIAEFDITSGVPPAHQKRYQEINMNRFGLNPLLVEKQWVLAALDTPGLHPQQEAILLLSYAAVLNRIEMWQGQRERLKETMPDVMSDDEAEAAFDFDTDIEIDTGLLLKITERVSPVHPVWIRSYGAQRFLIEKIGHDEEIIEYLHLLVERHPEERVVSTTLTLLVQHQAADYASVEEMDVYRLVLQRYGEGDMTRQAHLIFQMHGPQAGSGG